MWFVPYHLLLCRRPAFSPDGSLLVVPTGILRGSAPNDTSHTFATHIFHRGDLQSPVVSLAGLEDPSVAVRFSPLLYSLRSGQGQEEPETLFKGAYR
jgi:chromatin assembly factor 1 subunit B